MRGQPAKAPASGSDPLAELARLIGQNDPFSEFGRDNARHAPPSRPAELPANWDDQPPNAEYAHPSAAPDLRAVAPHAGANNYYAAAPTHPAQPDAPSYGAQNYGRQSFGSPQQAADSDLYHHEGEVPGYPAAQAGGYGNDPYHQNQPTRVDDEDLYDDVPPPRRRIGIMAIAGVFALAVVGTAGAFGYRALFGTTGTSQPPPVIKADTAPSKIVPAATSKDTQSSKLINDRVNDRGQGERLVSREEQPVDIKDKQAAAMFPQGQDTRTGSSGSPQIGSGVVGSEPKKVRTIAIRPDQSGNSEAMPASAPAAAPSPPPARQAAPVQALPPRVASNPPPAADPEPAPPPRQRVAPAAPQAAAPSRNAPLSLSPDAPAAQARAAAPPVRTAAVAPTQTAPAASGGGGGNYAVQVSSQRSEADAQTAFRSLQGKFPGQLGNRQPLIHRVDLGDKGIYFRAMVGPFGSAGEAGELCSSLKAAGGQCIVQRN